MGNISLCAWLRMRIDFGPWITGSSTAGPCSGQVGRRWFELVTKGLSGLNPLQYYSGFSSPLRNWLSSYGPSSFMVIKWILSSGPPVSKFQTFGGILGDSTKSTVSFYSSPLTWNSLQLKNVPPIGRDKCLFQVPSYLWASSPQTNSCRSQSKLTNLSPPRLVSPRELPGIHLQSFGHWVIPKLILNWMFYVAYSQLSVPSQTSKGFLDPQCPGVENVTGSYKTLPDVGYSHQPLPGSLTETYNWTHCILSYPSSCKGLDHPTKHSLYTSMRFFSLFHVIVSLYKTISSLGINKVEQWVRHQPCTHTPQVPSPEPYLVPIWILPEVIHDHRVKPEHCSISIWCSPSKNTFMVPYQTLDLLAINCVQCTS